MIIYLLYRLSTHNVGMWFGLVEMKMKCNNLEWCVSGEDTRPERRETARQESDGAIECEYF